VSNSRTHTTSALSAVRNGHAGGAERLWPAVYDELHRVAHARLAREGLRGDLQPTVVVQEADLRLVGREGVAIPASRWHFFAAAANARRQRWNVASPTPSFWQLAAIG